MKKTLVLMIVFFNLVGCASLPAVLNRENQAKKIAQDFGFTQTQIKANDFTITSFYKLLTIDNDVVVYIEGDGLAWHSKNRLSSDPTPRNPTALELATADASPNIIYLARPCQYGSLVNDSLCEDSAYWTNKRFAPEVAQSLNEAISHHQKRGGFTKIHLVGFSGGGALSVLIASMRKDVVSLRTVAGNLDHVFLNEYHNVSQLEGSLNARDVAKKAQHIPQIHFIGKADKVVPSLVSASFKEAMEDTGCAQFIEVRGVEHVKGWAENWPQLSAIPAQCTTVRTT